MSISRAILRFVLVPGLVSTLSACGFHPLYGGNGRLSSNLSSIYVEPVGERDGYELRNSLIDLLGSDGEVSGKTYRLKVTLVENSQGVALQNDATITRYNDTLAANYVLTDAKGTVLTKGTQNSLSSYNVAVSPYSTLSAQQDADKRSAQDIADRIRIDLGVYFASRKMKIKDAERYVARPPADLMAALIFGPDAGLVRERAEKLAMSVVPDLADPFRIAELSESTLTEDGARLFDEAAAIAMLGGRRVVRVRGAGNALAPLFEDFLENPVGDALVLVESGDLAKGTGLRRLFEDDEKAAAIACYPDNARGLGDVVRDALRAEGLSIAPDAVEDAVSRLGSDRGVTRRELEKLALYAHGRQQVTLGDVRAAMGDEAEIRTEEACDAAAGGEFARLDLALERLWLAGTAPVAVLRSAMGHFQRLALVKDLTQRGESLDSALKKLRPPLHFSRADSFKAQLRRWSAVRLADALDMLLDAEALCKTTAVPDRPAAARALMNVAALAKAQNAC